MDDAASSGSHDDHADDLTSDSVVGNARGEATNHGWLESERRFVKQRLDLRLDTAARERNYLCTVCSALCDTTTDLQRHLSKHVSDLKAPPSARVCTICSLEFISRMALNVHRNSPRHKERELRIRSLFHCDHCGQYFANRDAYAMHMLDVTREAALQNGEQKHLGLVANEVDTLSFLHSLAANSASPSSSASSHVEIVKVKEEPCDKDCADVRNGVTSSTSESGENNNATSANKTQPLDLSHVKLEDEIRLSPIDGHICRVCSQIFDSRDSLAMHAMEHCKDETFSSDGVGLTHISCHVCGRHCPDLGSLSMHMLLHSRPRHLEATLVAPPPSKFASKKNGEAIGHLGYGDLATDIIRQDSITSFTCKLCDLEFSSLFSITRHCTCVSHILKVEQLLRQSFANLVRTEAEVYKCVDCGKDFQRDCDYRIHKSLMCTGRARSPLQSPIGQASVCSEPSGRKRNFEFPLAGAKRVRSVSSELGIPLRNGTAAASSSSSRKDPFPRRTMTPDVRSPLHSRPGSSRPLSVDSGRSASPDHDAAAIRQQILAHLESLPALQMCAHCKIVYTDKTMYYLHMGLHNHNNPWQCNLCGKICDNVHEFSSHVIHYS